LCRRAQRKGRKEGYIEENGYIISWCVAQQLVGLADAQEYNEIFSKWQREDLPIIPDTWKHTVLDSKKKQFETLRSLMNRKDVTSLVCETDAGREGELIFRFVYKMAGCKKPFSRLWISSMEESVVRKGFAEQRDEKKRHAILIRNMPVESRLAGINAVRLFSKIYNKTFNIGRVQTPTLAMLAERSARIIGFFKEKHHIVHLDLGGLDTQSEHIKEPDKVAQIQATCQNWQAV